MVRTLMWVLAGLLVYTALTAVLRSRGLVPDYVRLNGPITTIHTGKGRAFLNWLARPRRFWRAWSNFGAGVALVVMVGSFLFIVASAITSLRDPEPSALNQPRNVLAIPGVNEFLPLSVAPEIVLGLVLGLVVHEGGHGLLCRAQDIDVESMGLALLTIIPVGAFVEPDEERLLDSDRGSQMRMYTAGVTNNFALAIVAMLLLFGPVVGSLAVVDGVPVGRVYTGSAADGAGIEAGDVITEIEGTAVASEEELQAVLANTSERTVSVTKRSGERVDLRRSVLVTAASSESPIAVNETIVAINGTAVGTSAEFREVAREHPVGTLTTADGRSITAPLGALGWVAPDGALAAAGAPEDEPIVVTSIGGERIVSASDLQDALDGRGPEEELTVVGYVDGQREVYEVTLQDGLVGLVQLQPGTTGMTVSDFGIDAYPAAFFLDALGSDSTGSERTLPGDAWSFQRLLLFLLLPFAAVSTGFNYNFAGFTDIATNFYVVEGPLSVLGAGGVFVLANALFWTSWLNFVIGQFNCIPTYPLDGGHMLRASTESIVSRLPISDRNRATSLITISITAIMIGSLLLMLFGPQFLT